MKYYIKSILILSFSFGLSWNRGKKDEFQIHTNYAASSDGNIFNVQFLKKSDTLFLSYFFYYDNGNYINAPADSLDYAGYFSEKNIKNNEINFNVKNYREYWRDSTRIFKLKLNFLSDSTLKWNINSAKYGIFDYLPNEMIFTSEK